MLIVSFLSFRFSHNYYYLVALLFQALQVGMIDPRHQYVITNLVSVNISIFLFCCNAVAFL